jgi:cellulose synthase (UDP-forming)
MSSAALLLTGPFPVLAMIWFFPHHIYPHNYLPMLPAIAATLFVFPLLSRGWRPTIYRVCMINSCCHMYAVWYALRGSVAEWVPTGASSRKGQVPRTVNRILLTWIVLVQGLLWSGLALRMDEFGWHLYWATALLAAVQLYMLAPLMTPGKGVWGRTQEEPAEVMG